MKIAYFIGIKGAGMAALAQLFKKSGFEVLGSDSQEKFFTDKILRKSGIKVLEGFSPKNIPLKSEVFIASNAYLDKRSNNPEVLFLKKKKKKIYSYPEAVSLFFNKSQGIAVCGTHGKSTTTSLVGLLLKEASLEPKVLVGGKVLNWQSNVYLGKGDFFVLEADEYKSAFWHYQPKIIILNSLEYDHPDFFKSQKSYLDSFKKFIGNLKEEGIIIAFRKDAQKIFKNFYLKKNFLKTIDILNKKGEILASFLLKEKGKKGNFWNFDLISQNKIYKNFQTKFGDVYLLNSSLAATLGIFLKIPLKKIRNTLKNYQGVERRFQVIKKKKYILIDDFAHHPTAIEKTIKLAKETFRKRKIIAIFQPHTFSRTECLLNDFAKSLSKADEVILLPIFASAREKEGKVSSEDISKKAKKKFYLTENFSQVREIVNSILGDQPQNFIILLLGAGDIYKLKKIL